ncbi:MAG: LLM class flavin-dependent oxidoreductase [Acidimicrobiia bacterium]|nr:LLM class flavin-dependent oxidoreductase [Acidimicrobiia bacterium]
MHVMYFTEQPMSAYPQEEGDRLGYTALLFSNEHYDPVEGSRLYNEYIEDFQAAEAVGFDGVMLNEHHNAPFCMSAKVNVMASVLAHATERVKIVLLGNPLPLADNPVRLAEELAMIDMISKGRLVAGIVRGGGTEQLSANVNPAYNRERFNEAHDLIVKAWTQPGPFRWEGEHYHQRVVNPWALPLQAPHPRIWVPGVSSPETIEWAAQHGYPYIVLNASIDTCKKIWGIYEGAAQQAGFASGPEHRGYLIRIHCQDTEEKAEEGARQFMWMQGEFVGLLHPVWGAPSGYLGAGARRPMALVRAGRKAMAGKVPFEAQAAAGSIIYGTPEQCIEQLRVLLTETRPSILSLWGNDGCVSHADAQRCIELLGKEVLPAVREIGEDLDLKSPFEVEAPTSLEHPAPAMPRAGAR